MAPTRFDMAASPPPSGLEQIQRQELSRLFGQIVWVRLLVIPILFGVVLWVVFSDPAAWRRGLGLGLAVCAMAFSASELLRFRRRGLGQRALAVNLAVGIGGQTLVMAATGGLTSPFVYPMTVLIAVVALNVPGRLLYWMVGFQVAAVWALAAVELQRLVPDLNPLLFGGGRAGHGDLHLVLSASVITFAVLASATIGRRVRSAFDGMLRGALAAQQDSLRSYSERAEELTALSGEIAHELKNPLASVKGLAGLMAQHPLDPKGAERLGVLRREVDRMQAILEEFLNFSRPLVPLTLGQVDVSALCRDVAVLHEGMGQEAGVELRVRGGSLAVRCDPRKVKQILVNLVQNALEATPRGAAVEIETAAEPDAVVVRILDGGPGPATELGEQVFDAGVTTKSCGSGLGLTISRALARQHGGELTLAARAGGGCAAELRLPAGRTGPATGAAA